MPQTVPVLRWRGHLQSCTCHIYHLPPLSVLLNHWLACIFPFLHQTWMLWNKIDAVNIVIFCFRVRKGFPFEARVVARILPQFLDDFFPPQDIMNKVIGEFLSNQQPYPQFMATVVYKVKTLLLFSFSLVTVYSSSLIIFIRLFTHL